MDDNTVTATGNSALRRGPLFNGISGYVSGYCLLELALILAVEHKIYANMQVWKEYRILNRLAWLIYFEVISDSLQMVQIFVAMYCCQVLLNKI